MTVTVIDSFDLYNGIGANTGLQAKWVADATTRLTLQAGRFGGQCVRLNAQNNATIVGQVHRVLPGSYAGAGVGIGFRASGLVALNAAPLSNMFMQLADSAGVMQVGLALGADGSINAYRLTGKNAGTLLGSSAAGVIGDTVWHFIEWAVAISDTVGTVVVKVDGTVVLNLAAQDTRNGTPTTVNQLYFSGALSATNIATSFDFDDLYVTDSAATLGERRVEVVYPSADTAQKDFTPSTGVTNSTCVDEATVSTVDYVQASTVGNLDLYDLANLATAPANIDAVQISAFAEKTDAASRSFALVGDIAGSQSQSADFVLAASYQKYEHLMTAKPGGGAWDGTAVNALKAGPKVTV